MSDNARSELLAGIEAWTHAPSSTMSAGDVHEPICVECGNDLACMDYPLCSGCLEECAGDYGLA